MAVFLVSKYLNRVMKISIVVANSAEPRVLLFVCVVWVIQNELLELFISPCELILMLLL